jgi:[ribosomal protein S5]-alanine N-acetyltransferase
MREVAGLSSVTMSTDRLTIASIGPEHIDALLHYHKRNDKHLARWEPARSPDFFTRGYWSTYVAAVQDDALHARAYRFIATLRGSREIISSVNVTNVVRGIFDAAVLGYSVDAKHEGHGYGREAVGAIVAWCFKSLGLHRVEANYQPNNERSGRLLRALGFVVEGYARDYLYIDGAWRDHILTSLTNHDDGPTPAGPHRRSRNGT